VSARPTTPRGCGPGASSLTGMGAMMEAPDFYPFLSGRDSFQRRDVA
jgi:hypothetical protein